MTDQMTQKPNNEEMIVLPRGSGYIVKISRNTQRPFCARRYVFTDTNGNSHSKDIGYFKTRKEAIQALADHITKTPLDLCQTSKTFSELYDIWKPQAEQYLKPITMKGYKTAYRKCSKLHNKPYADISANEMQAIVSSDPSAKTQLRIRNLFKKLDLLADSMDIITKRRSEYVIIKTYYSQNARIPFSNKEIDNFLKHADDPDVQFVLFLLYTGFRSGEVCDLLKQNVNLSDMTIVGGKKTENGTMRIVPIHPRIAGYVRNCMNGPSPYLFTAPRGGRLYQDRLIDHFKDTCFRYCDRPHIPHECRHTMITRFDEMKADRICVNKIMGHKPVNVADRIYSHRTLDELREAIMLLW